jgi:hypothetical protein
VYDCVSVWPRDVDYHKGVYDLGMCINKQLQGILLLTKVLVLSTIKYKLEEQATVAKICFKCHDDLKELKLF